MDNTWLPAPNTSNLSLQDLAVQAQQNLQKWHDILQSSSRQLNPKKCVWMLFNWHFKPAGTAQIKAPAMPPEITTTITGSEPYPIRRLQPNKAHRYLGIQLTTDGNHKRELQTFKECTQRYTNFIHQCPLTAQDTSVVYLQCYLPTVSYPLPATLFPPEKLIKIQGSATSAFLSKMGYPRMFPHAITYASTRLGGLGFRHLGHEQGVQQCLQLIKHIRANTTTGKTYQILIQQYQLYAGFSHLILEKTNTIQWSVAPWMDNIQKFLRHINRQIIQKNHGYHNHIASMITRLWKTYRHTIFLVKKLSNSIAYNFSSGSITSQKSQTTPEPNSCPHITTSTTTQTIVLLWQP